MTSFSFDIIVEKERGRILSLLTKVLATAVAIEFFYILYLETFATTSKKTSKVFHFSIEELKQPSVQVLLKNQGVYNGMIAILVLVSTFWFSSQVALMSLMLYILVVASYGAISSDPKILLKQGGLAFLTLITLLV